jgi:8-oxo-dGTP pyrophosphatase MutT (NUDIX family)
MPDYAYTIGFLRNGDRVLLVNREKPPWMGCWNGVGGKLRPGETPRACIVREVREETGILVRRPQPRGVVTWEVDGAICATSCRICSAANRPSNIAASLCPDVLPGSRGLLCQSGTRVIWDYPDDSSPAAQVRRSEARYHEIHRSSFDSGLCPCKSA